LVERGVVLAGVVLGIWQAGGVYVPLDPGDPAERLAWLVADAGVGVVVTGGGLAGRVPAGVVRVDVADVVPAAAGAAAVVDPGQAAYVMYTSGSTGRPKGVVVPHGGIVNRLLWMQEELVLGGGDRVLHKAPVTFDVSLWELLWPLVAGACLVVAEPGGHRDGRYLAGLMGAGQVTVAHFVPSLLGLFLGEAGGGLPGEDGGGGLGSLRLVVCSGEVLTAGLAGRLGAVCGARLLNLYGPTEASVDVTWWEWRRGDGGAVPVGWPVANTGVHVLDGWLQPLPAHAAGEICIGGVALARGYLGRPGLTAAAFVPDPLGGPPGGRLYRTGDRARRRPGGEVEFLGRGDGQVKIAGNRVELGEVEDALREIPGVAAAAAAVRGAGPATRLTAYITPTHPGRPPTAAEIRAALRRRLPAVMVPADVIVLAALPMTASGKLDRRALAAAPRSAPETPARPSVPQAMASWTPAQRQFAAVWAETLAVPGPGLDDDFFAYGGDSIQAIRLVARARAAGLLVTAADLMRDATIRGLAASADRPPGARGRSAEDEERVAPFALCGPATQASFPAGTEDAYPISMAQRALIFQQMHNPAYEAYVTTLHLRAPWEDRAMRAAVSRLMDRHPYLRSSFDLTSHHTPLQLVHDRAEPPVTVADLRHLTTAQTEEALAAWLHAERGTGFDLSSGPLVRFRIHRRTAGEFQVSLSSFALDGWCSATVLTELLNDYSALRRGAAPATIAPAAGYGDFVALELQAMQAPEQRSFWAAELAAAQPSLLPRWPVPEPPAGLRQQRHVIGVDPDVTAALRRLATDNSVPLKSVLLAAHLRVLRMLTGRPSVVTGLEANGRPERIDGDRMVGVFNNVIPLLVNLPAGSWADLTRAAFQAETRAYPYRRYPFALLDREHRVRKLTDSLFVYTHFRVYEQLTGLHGLEVIGGEAPDQTYFPMTSHFNLDARTQELRVLIDYDPRQVPAEFAAAAAGYLERSLDLAAANPDRSWAADGLLTRRALRTQLTTWNPPAAGPPAAALHHSFLRQAAAAPDAIAVTDGDVQLTYAALARRSAQLAAALRGAGIPPGSVIGLRGPRRAEVVPALLGILRAGCAYLPLDWTCPVPRARQMLTAAAAAAVIGPDDTDYGTGLPVLRWDAAGSAGIWRDPPAHPAALAYVIFTSGSAGEPKPVAIPHAALANYLAWCVGAYLSEGHRDSIVHSSVGFDLTVTSLLAPLAAGGTVRLLPDDAGPETVADVLASTPVALLKITPAHLEAVGHRLAQGAGRHGSLAGLRCVVVGGEQFRGIHLAPWQGLLRDAAIVNEYGPTEATVGCCTHRTDLANPEEAVPIGLPIPGTQAYVASDGQLAPPGVTGELLVGGEGLARGYLSRPGMTAGVFVPDPFGARPGARLYRTGDLCRRAPDGQLAFIGRGDRQLKVSGHRVEPAEVEAEICRHPGVAEAAVLPRPGRGGRIRLAACYVPAPGGGPAPAELGAWLRGRLPDYLVPADLDRLPALPRGRDGKVDVAGLADPSLARHRALLETIQRLTDQEVSELLASEAADLPRRGGT
jgi:nonribosomal peptide synthetase protein BlmVI